MARSLSARLRITGELRAVTPLHVGGFGEDVDTDLPLARDGRGRLYVPGTSLAGPIRDWFRTAFPDLSRPGSRAVDDLWGFQEDDRGHASFVLVEDARVTLPEGALVEVRDGVGIDRVDGVAARHIKYDRAVLPCGTRLRLELTAEIGSSESASRIQAMFGHLIDAMTNDQIRLGAARTRGLGRVRLEGGTILHQGLDRRASILDVLRDGGRTMTAAELRQADPDLKPQSKPRLTVTIAWRPLSPVMVKAGYDGVAVDMLPLVSGVDERLAPVLPGSSIKGAFRSNAERIVRTVLDREARPEQGGTRRFLNQLKDVDLVTSLFGSPGDSEDEPPADDDAPRLGLGALAIDDCFAAHSVTSEQWAAIEAAGDERPDDARAKTPLRSALDAAGWHGWAQAMHVAVDRWTGGAAENFLYSVLEPHAVRWNPIALELDLTRLTVPDRRPALALLFLVLRDLSAGRLPLGFGTHRGMGSLGIEAVHLRGVHLDADGVELPELHDLTLVGGSLDHLPAEVRTRLTDAWQGWIDQPREARP